MVAKNDKLFAAISIIIVGLLAVITPFADVDRLGVMALLYGAALATHRLL